MGRRYDHEPNELRDLIASHAGEVMAERGLRGFTASEVASRVGYSVSTITSAFGGVQGLVSRVGDDTLHMMAQSMRRALEDSDPAMALIDFYFAFARENRNRWEALYAHIPEAGEQMQERRKALFEVVGIVQRVISAEVKGDRLDQLTRSVLATVYGHASSEISGTYGLGIEADALAAAKRAVQSMMEI